MMAASMVSRKSYIAQYRAVMGKLVVAYILNCSRREQPTHNEENCKLRRSGLSEQQSRIITEVQKERTGHGKEIFSHVD